MNDEGPVSRTVGMLGASIAMGGWGLLLLFGIMIGVGELIHDWRVYEKDQKKTQVEADRLARAEARNLAEKEFQAALKPELGGAYFLVAEKTGLFLEPSGERTYYFIKAGSCVRARRVSAKWIQFDTNEDAIARYAKVEDTIRLAPGGRCDLTRDAVGSRY